MSDTEKFMLRCLELAKNGLGFVNPNPLVGCVIAKDGEVISEGWHAAVGQYHAERMAIMNVQDSTVLKDCDLYVNLEPCSHFGRTPPCADLIVEHQFKRVFVGFGDPNPLVAGTGIQRLQQHGIEVVADILVDQCKQLNRFFYTFHTKKRPFVTLKWAESKDNFMAPDPLQKMQISGNDTQLITHKMRAEHSAILVGVTTWVVDKPQLNNRLIEGPSPLKMVLDPNLRGNYGAQNAPLIVFNHLKNEINNGVEFVQLTPHNTLNEIMNFMFERQLNSLMVEGGAKTLQAFIQANLADEIHVYTSKSVLLNNGVISPKHALKISNSSNLNSDCYTIYSAQL